MYLDFATFSNDLLILSHSFSSSFIRDSKCWACVLSLNMVSIL